MAARSVHLVNKPKEKKGRTDKKEFGLVDPSSRIFPESSKRCTQSGGGGRRRPIAAPFLASSPNTSFPPHENRRTLNDQHSLRHKYTYMVRPRACMLDAGLRRIHVAFFLPSFLVFCGARIHHLPSSNRFPKVQPWKKSARKKKKKRRRSSVLDPGAMEPRMRFANKAN